MISHCSGTVSAAGPTWVVLDNHGVGIKVLCPPATAASARIDQDISLQTSLVVREDSLTLYGFVEADDRDAFELVQTASGVGPKLAAAIMSVLDASQLATAITEEDDATLCRVPGIGRKGAAKMILELKDKMAAFAPRGPSTSDAAHVTAPWREQVAEGLVGLGWSAKDAEKAVDEVAALKDADPAMTIGNLMRAALRSLAR
ncbi:Holliday junction branch migration protein RuvA [Cutibacterium namnetense]|uniref:Holliday junction branch migration complex subunit RuvA n=1 Tax=[Propionibacterium] namnetense SK182B-JCVI TaxID=1051006 RepID=F9NT67_9ACTN|nr:Holliday junction branch migration protein RuvA [Cutibacterium namnetense]EGR97687.1 Holliday junction DNA helicase RuvA [ [[Propionibacterium] namnetense SK182B-JCVI]TKW73231.1 MAG: Holliday junction branch migration protein RuvA [Cutibacterium acnes]